MDPATNRDLYNEWNAQFVTRATVAEKPETGGVAVVIESDSTGIFETYPSNQVVCLWSDYEERRALRAAEVTGAKRGRAERLARCAQALTSAKKRYPGASLVDGNIVIDAEEFLKG